MVTSTAVQKQGYLIMKLLVLAPYLATTIGKMPCTASLKVYDLLSQHA